MNDKRVLITGATNGIGKQAALEIAALGASVTIVGRNEAKTRAVCSELQAGSGNEQIDWLLGDLSSMDEVRRVADEFRARHERLDVLLNNAGASFSEYQASADGYEMTFALNHMSYFLLTNLLLDMLQATAAQQGEARIVNVSSSAHNAARREDILPAALRHPQPYRAFRVYGASKLMNILFTNELARRLNGTGVSVNAAHPGLVNTGFGDNMSGVMRYLFGFMKRVAGRTPQKGAETLVFLAASSQAAGITGAYWVDKAQRISSDLSHDRSLQAMLWQFSAEISGVG